MGALPQHEISLSWLEHLDLATFTLIIRDGCDFFGGKVKHSFLFNSLFIELFMQLHLSLNYVSFHFISTWFKTISAER